MSKNVRCARNFYLFFIDNFEISLRVVLMTGRLVRFIDAPGFAYSTLIVVMSDSSSAGNSSSDVKDLVLPLASEKKGHNSFRCPLQCSVAWT